MKDKALVAEQAGVRKVVELVRDWETLHGSDFDAKYGLYKDSFGFLKSLPQIIELYFGIGKPSSDKLLQAQDKDTMEQVHKLVAGLFCKYWTMGSDQKTTNMKKVQNLYFDLTRALKGGKE